MGEMVVSSHAGEELVAIGLGSCIGLTLVDRTAGVAGLAHIVLPESGIAAEPVGKYADLAVPDLIRRMLAAGAFKFRLEAVLVGGAKMFPLGLDIGTRNAGAVRDALGGAGIQIHATETGGNRGRTARVMVGGDVTSHVAGGERLVLLSMRQSQRSRPPVPQPGLAGARS